MIFPTIFHFNLFTPNISILILLIVCHTFYIFNQSLTDFQNFPGAVAFFQHFPDLENATTKFQDFPGFPGPIRALCDIYEPLGECICTKIQVTGEISHVIIIHQIFSLAHDWSKRVTWANIPQVKLGNIQEYSPIFKTVRVAKKI